MRNYIVERRLLCTQTLIVEANSAKEARDIANENPNAEDMVIELTVKEVRKAHLVRLDSRGEDFSVRHTAR